MSVLWRAVDACVSDSDRINHFTLKPMLVLHRRTVRGSIDKRLLAWHMQQKLLSAVFWKASEKGEHVKHDASICSRAVGD